MHHCVQEADLVIKEEPYMMRLPRSQRGGEVIEPLVREQWFVRMQPLAEPALKVSTLFSHLSAQCPQSLICSCYAAAEAGAAPGRAKLSRR